MTPEITPASQTEALSAELQRKVRDQGIAQTAMFDHLLGAGKELWADDEEFERFLASVEATRAEEG